jgi:hypothetical protein
MYNLIKSSPSLIAVTKSKWTEQAENFGDFGVMVTDDVINIFNRIESDQSDNEHVYFLVENTGDHGKAILKVMHAMPHVKDNSYLKLLNIHLEPNLIFDFDGNKSSEKLNELYSVLASSILEAIKLIFLSSVCKLKIYGRTEEMRSIFLALIANQTIEKSIFSDNGLSAYVESAWLVIQKNTGGKNED